MKNLLAKLKGTNYKQAAIDHGEKLFLGVTGLFVLTQLGFTNWSRYDRQPKEFQDKVEAGERNIQASAFTVEEQNKYKPLEIMQAVQTLQSPLEVGRYEYSTNWFWSMYPTVKKIAEPNWLAAIEPIADFGKAVIVEAPLSDQSQPSVATAIEGSEAAKKLAAADDDDEFAPKRAATDPAGRGGVGAPGSATQNDGAGIGSAKPSVGSYKSMTSGTDAGIVEGMGMSGSGRGGMGAMGSQGQSRPKVNAHGNRFVSVRAVFPLGDQLDELVKAMHEQRQKAADFVTFLDFEVERQVAQPGDKPWSGLWEKVDLQATLDLLDRIEFDTDVVDPVFTDSVFTMPLPQRVIGKWKTKLKDWASHPLIKTMTDEQAELQAQLNTRLVEESAKKKSEDKFAKKGFSTKVHDARGLRSQFSGQANGIVSEMGDMMRQGQMQAFNPNLGADELSGAMGGITNSMTATGNGKMSKYLLFRYFDFQVTPGNAYRYRVRMTLLNPNFKRPVEELVDESIAAGEVRVTPWSEPTLHVFVPEEQRLFLAKAEKPKTDAGLPVADIDVYQWFSEAGTTIAAKVVKTQLGQFIAGPCKDTEVYRPANDTLNKEEIPVFTGSLLADVAAAPTTAGFDLAEHADLKLDVKKLNQLTTTDKALVVDRFGQMAILDNKSVTDERAAAEKVVEIERRAIRDRIKERPTANNAGGDLGGEMGMPSGMGMPGGMGMAGGNSLKKGAKSPATKKASGKGKTKTAPGAGT